MNTPVGAVLTGSPYGSAARIDRRPGYGHEQRPVSRARWQRVGGDDAAARAEGPSTGDGALGRLDVLSTLDGVDDGLWALGALAARGVHVLNDPAALLASHDKLLTARILRRHAIAHPTTIHIRDGRVPPRFVKPVVVKRRFGSWGSEVHRCDDPAMFSEALARISEESWFQRHGALVQELRAAPWLRPSDHRGRRTCGRGRSPDLRRRRVAYQRQSWRSPPSGRRSSTPGGCTGCGSGARDRDRSRRRRPPATTDGGWVVIELNGAVEFTSEYSEWIDVFSEALFCSRVRCSSEARGWPTRTHLRPWPSQATVSSRSPPSKPPHMPRARIHFGTGPSGMPGAGLEPARPLRDTRF